MDGALHDALREGERGKEEPADPLPRCGGTPEGRGFLRRTKECGGETENRLPKGAIRPGAVVHPRRSMSLNRRSIFSAREARTSAAGAIRCRR